MVDSLDSARKELTLVDNALISLILQRMEIARRMGVIKHREKLPLLPEGFTIEKATASRAEKATVQGANVNDAKIVEKTFAVLVQAAIDAESEVQQS